MRITPEQIEIIVKTIRSVAGPDVRVWLFGSRLDDERRGGDLDLLIESAPAAGLIQRARIKLLLEQVLQLPVDILATCFGAPDSAFVSKLSPRCCLPISGCDFYTNQALRPTFYPENILERAYCPSARSAT